MRETKAKKAKDGVTAIMGTNADGTDKVPFLVIGKAENTRSFRLG